MNCPHCGSDKTRKYSIVYEEGTSHGKGESSSWVGATYTTEHFSQTPLAKRCSPPERPAVGKLLSVLGIAFSAWAAYKMVVLFKVSPNWAWWAVTGAFFVSLAALGILWFVLFGKRKRVKYDELYAIWTISWVCMKCGESFIGK